MSSMEGTIGCVKYRGESGIEGRSYRGKSGLEGSPV